MAGGWSGQGFPGYTGYGWYRKTFSVPADFAPEQTLKMLFGAVDEDAEIWLNGQKAFDHTCSSTGLSPNQIWVTPFTFDPGLTLRRGQANVLAVRVYNRLGMGGIWQPVYLLAPSAEGVPPYILLASIRAQH